MGRIALGVVIRVDLHPRSGKFIVELTSARILQDSRVLGSRGRVGVNNSVSAYYVR